MPRKSPPENQRARLLLMEGKTPEETAKTCGLELDKVREIDRWLRAVPGQEWLSRVHPDKVGMFGGKPSSLKPPPAQDQPDTEPAVHAAVPARVQSTRIIEVGGGTRQQVVVREMPGTRHEVSGEHEFPSVGLSTKDISVKMTPVSLMMLNYAKSIGYDMPSEVFIEEAIVEYFKMQGITLGVIKHEDQLRDLVRGKNTKIYVVMEETQGD